MSNTPDSAEPSGRTPWDRRGEPVRERMLEWIGAYWEDHGIPPTIREICDGCGISSTSVVHYHLGKLEAAGYIRRTPRISRGIVLIEPEVAA